MAFPSSNGLWHMPISKNVELCLPVPRHSVSIMLRYLPSEKRRSLSSISTFTDGRHNMTSCNRLARSGHLQNRSPHHEQNLHSTEILTILGAATQFSYVNWHQYFWRKTLQPSSGWKVSLETLHQTARHDTPGGSVKLIFRSSRTQHHTVQVMATNILEKGYDLTNYTW
jgi:hypothetical protein